MSTNPLSESQLLPPRPKASTPPAPSSTTSSPSTPSPPDAPLSLSTSLLLSSPTLPLDARTALQNLNATLDPPTLKVAVRFHAIGSAPQLSQKVFKISASHKFGAVVSFLRRKLYGKDVEKEGGRGLFCYVNSVFAPGLDEGVGNLWRVSLL